MSGTRLLLLLQLCASTAFADDIWTPHINNGPAPPPDKRPPIARNATYDPSLLKWQIPALVGSYLVVVLFIGACILGFGKRMRKEALSGAKPISVEMVKPSKGNMEPSPISPAGSLWNKWGTPRIGRHKSDASRSPQSPEAPSIVSFDTAIIEQDKQKREQEMARIYGEIMKQGQHVKAPRSVEVKHQPVQDDQTPLSPGPQQHRRNPSTSSRSFSHRDPPQRQASQRSQHTQPLRTRGSGNVQAIHPPEHQQNAANTLSPGVSGYYPTDMLAASPSVAPTTSRTLHTDPSAPPPYTHSRQASSASERGRRPARTSSIRDLPISDPIPIPTLEDEIAAEARAPPPKSPRYYHDPGRPPTPPTIRRDRPATMIEDASDDEILSPRGASQLREEEESDEEILTDDEFDRERHNNWSPDAIIGSYGEPRTPRTPLPPQQTQSQQHPRRPATERLAPAQSPESPAFGLESSTPSRTTTPGQSSIRTTAKTPPALTISPPQRTTTPGGTTRAPPQQLHVRAIHPPQMPLASPGLASPPIRSAGLSPGLMPYSPAQMISPGGTKTTFLSPRREAFPGGMAPMSGFGLAPSTARLYETGMATPYSPYMPYTPMTPATPHMTTRRERKEQERQRGRFAVTEEDIVEDERDMWGDGYRDD